MPFLLCLLLVLLQRNCSHYSPFPTGQQMGVAAHSLTIILLSQRHYLFPSEPLQFNCEPTSDLKSAHWFCPVLKCNKCSNIVSSVICACFKSFMWRLGRYICIKMFWPVRCGRQWPRYGVQRGLWMRQRRRRYCWQQAVLLKFKVLHSTRNAPVWFSNYF